jgi:hypothetical protein
MSQATDYVLANQSGANFRTELNSVLAAVVSQNSGSTAPSTTYAYQFWIDTGVSPALLKLRNSANNAWITVGDVTAANLGLLTTTSAASTYLALAGGTVTGNLEIGTAGSLTFEGSTPDANETTLAVTDATAARTVTLPDATGTVALLSLAQSYTAAQRGEITTLTDAATIAVDFADSNNFSVTLGGGRTLGNPTNQVAGQSGSLFVVQDGTGSRTLAYSSDWEFAGGTAPTLSTAASAVDRIDYIVRASGNIHAVFTAAYS